MITTRYQTRRHVVRHETSWEDVGQFAKSLGWQLVKKIHSEPEDAVDGQVIWQALDVAALHYTEDATSGIDYFVLVGQNERTVEALAQQASDAVRPLTLDETFQEFDQADDPLTRAQSVLQVGLAAPQQFDAGVFSRVSDALADPDDRVRLAGLWATTYSGYPEFLPKLQELASREPDHAVRAQAQTIVDGFSKAD